MNNPLIQGVLARTASAQGERVTAAEGSKTGNSDQRQAASAGGQDAHETRARTERILNDVLVNFGGQGASSSRPRPESTLRPSHQPAEANHSGPRSEQKVAFIYGEGEEAAFFSTEAPFRFGYRTGYPMHLLAAMDELENEIRHGLRALRWELAGEELVAFGEAAESAGRFLEMAMRKVQERKRQQINYPGGSVEVQLYSKVGKHLADYVHKEFSWRLSAGETIGYLESTPAVVALAYQGMFAPAATFAWQGNRLWIKGSSKDVESFLHEATPWMLEHGIPLGR